MKLSAVTNPHPLVLFEGALWHERVHVAFHRLDTETQNHIRRTIENSKHCIVKNVHKFVTGHYTKNINSEILAYLTVEYSVDKNIVKEIFPPELAPIIIDIFEKALLSDEELLHIKNVANQMVGEIDFKSKTISESL